MALKYMTGFDLQDATLRGWTVGVTSASTPFGVGSSWRFGTSVSGGVVFSPAVAKIFTGYACATSGGNNVLMSLRGDNAATIHLTVTVNSTTGVLTLARGATTLATSAAGVFPVDGSWHYLEASATISDTTGTCVVKVDGATVINFGPGDTKNGGTNSTIDTVSMASVSGGVILVDDFYVCDDSGSTNNTFLGPWFRVQTCKPSAAGSSTQFTPISGSNFSNVNDVPDNTATYNSDTVSGHRDTFALDDIISGTDTIFAVQQVMHARQLDGGTATIKQAQKSGATVSYGGTKTLVVGNAAYSDLFETNPATGVAYTQSEINALEAGYEIV